MWICVLALNKHTFCLFILIPLKTNLAVWISLYDCNNKCPMSDIHSLMPIIYLYNISSDLYELQMYNLMGKKDEDFEKESPYLIWAFHNKRHFNGSIQTSSTKCGNVNSTLCILLYISVSCLLMLYWMNVYTNTLNEHSVFGQGND